MTQMKHQKVFYCTDLIVASNVKLEYVSYESHCFYLSPFKGRKISEGVFNSTNQITNPKGFNLSKAFRFSSDKDAGVIPFSDYNKNKLGI